ncbi:HK97 family phage prohead protease [Tenacibaculum maritimum]|nr:HK97 family phage prohead protease [Tenacibaculum maritimum]MDB0611258.1 HK97 family phage prohead protease [Tenacibaculum maritimum]
MPKDKNKNKKPFVFNDESVINSYGFKILTKGISQKRFKKNPVMLDSHWNNNWAVIGSWENIKADGAILTGEPVFDEEDDNASLIKGKVDRGFLKSCSMGVLFNREDFKVIDDELVLTKCELMEVSIVAIPSNSHAVRLYAKEDKKALTEDAIKNLCLSVQPPELSTSEPKNTDTNMKITLTTAAAAAISLTAGTNEIESADLSEKIVQLNAKKNAAELKLQTKLDAEETAKLAAVTKSVDNAVAEGKISAESKDKFVNLGVANPDILKETLGAIPAKKSLGATITSSGGESSGEVKTKEDFQKLSHDEQMQFKAENPQAYVKLFTSKK